MKCPKCDSQMSEVLATDGKSVDRCNECNGLFVSRNALHSLERNWFFWPKSDSHCVDWGDPAVGKQFDKIGEIDCPACRRAMDPISVPDQPHIWLERCPECAGVFFDAGELTDLRFHTMVDRVRDLVKGPRPECGNRRAASEGESAPDAESCGRDSASADEDPVERST